MPSRRCLHLAAASLALSGTALQAAPTDPSPGVLQPVAPGQSQPTPQTIPSLKAQTPHGPGDIIPPCVIAFGWTTQGPTDREGNLISQPVPVSLPRTYLIGRAAAQRR